ncbi:hypothetical protein QCM77_35920 [Bradyrhizobium sp. SSUT18]|uniref:hypothetical protein n=1 Tax=Bradyrhizobium sp. SSUT18 TaxID=3040602 RepID=UPI002446D19D|nr:hypothetical protein [Bradyrhizobium sp. SSUT18]MDH2405255.1 hypothetical protein [Bradyrhizobium sp. SSUT18]
MPFSIVRSDRAEINYGAKYNELLFFENKDLLDLSSNTVAQAASLGIDDNGFPHRDNDYVASIRMIQNRTELVNPPRKLPTHGSESNG